MTTLDQLVINFHMTESCNYRCGYCYATWNDHCSARELHRHSGEVERLLDGLSDYFLNPNPLQQALGYRSVRLNFAGGEPMLLGDRFVQALHRAQDCGFETSIITNGHFLDEAMLEALAPRLSVLGISYDSMNPETVQRIGRQDRKGRGLSRERLIEMARQYRALNPRGVLKINTVVNAFNWQEDMRDLGHQVRPDKWKLLRVLPVHDHNLVISDAQYRAFVERHAELGTMVVEEDNQDMRQSYLMIDPEGRFYQNGEAGQGYILSSPILQVGVARALTQVPFDAEAFARRYQLIPVQAV
ncbi:radical SAM protein [Marinobacterium nitratireducens]|uniref:S-adenosylmethionine-dependent nucleotide dehydratase n=1 Tax=Marinobacterium nitratireducens TaxID=518897 RepID=A0A918DQ87_9GAMM|nr:viperin family antiviral radical SAM protein [Marinobacterium nitratireducens]GGO77599.1 radical SAM protein [Marinobacterium nitratireducens]